MWSAVLCIASLISGEDDESDESQESHEEDGEDEENANQPPRRYPNPPLHNPMAKLRKARYLQLDRLCIMQTIKQGQEIANRAHVQSVPALHAVSGAPRRHPALCAAR